MIRIDVWSGFQSQSLTKSFEVESFEEASKIIKKEIEQGNLVNIIKTDHIHGMGLKQ